MEKAEKLKAEANNLFKEKKYVEASSKYFAAVSAIRVNTELAATKQAKDAEMACRSNIAMCKLNLEEYD